MLFFSLLSFFCAQIVAFPNSVLSGINLGLSVKLNDTYIIPTTEELWLINYYSPNCPKSRDLIPHWAKLTYAFTSVNGLHFGHVDCSVYEKYCDDIGIAGYPTLNLYWEGQHTGTYDGLENEHDIRGYIDGILMSYMFTPNTDSSNAYNYEPEPAPEESSKN